MATRAEGSPSRQRKALILTDSATKFESAREQLQSEKFCVDCVPVTSHEDTRKLPMGGYDLVIVDHKLYGGAVRQVVDEYLALKPGQALVFSDHDRDDERLHTGAIRITPSTLTKKLEIALDELRRIEQQSDDAHHRHAGVPDAADQTRTDALPQTVELLQARNFASTPRLMQAEHQLRQIQDQHPGNNRIMARCYLNVGRAHENAGNIEKALEFYERITQLGKDNYAAVLPELALHVTNCMLQRGIQRQKAKLDNVAHPLLQFMQQNSTDSLKGPKGHWWDELLGRKTNVITPVDLLEAACIEDPTSPELKFTLAHIKALQGHNDRAYGLLEEALQSFDPNDVAGMVDAEQVISSLRALQIAGQHNVVRVVPPILHRGQTVIKTFTPDQKDRAELEERILNALADKPALAKMDNREEAFYTPFAVLLRPPQESAKNYHLIMENVPGHKVVHELLGLDTRYRYNLIKAVVDASTALSFAINTIVPDTQDVRKTMLQRTMHRHTNTLDFHSARFFDKIIKGMDTHTASFKDLSPGVKIEEVERLLHDYAPVAQALITVSDWMVQVYTDANLRNYHVTTRTGTGASLADTITSRIDLETADKRLFLSDIITATEHEDAKLTPRQAYILALRASANVAGRYASKETMASLRDLLREQYCEGDPQLPTDRDVTRLERSLETAVHTFDATFTIQKFQTLLQHASLERHLTIVGDKLRDKAAHVAFIKKLIENYPSVNEFREARKSLPPAQLSEEEDLKHAHYEDKARLLPLDPQEQAVMAYLHVRQSHRECEKIEQYHKAMVLRRINELGLYSLRSSLNTSFNMWPEIGAAVDLQVHTEGKGTMDERVDRVLREAEEKGLGAIAIADHNHTATAERAAAKAAGSGLDVVSGVELDAAYHNQRTGTKDSCHVIAYFAPETDEFRSELQRLFVNRQLSRMDQMLRKMVQKRLIEFGSHTTVKQRLDDYADQGPVTRATLATLLAENVRDTRCTLRKNMGKRREDARVRYILEHVLNEDAPPDTCCYVSSAASDVPNLKTVFSFCRKYGMLFGYSHLMFDAPDKTVARELFSDGCGQGTTIIGIGHPRHNPTEVRFLRSLASKARTTYHTSYNRRIELPAGRMVSLNYSAGYPQGGFEDAPPIGMQTMPLTVIADLKELHREVNSR